jgi:prepilin-type N-terminal cleavage/methylation domain-containing protein
MSVRSYRSSRASERGFSLIELGIVIAVIAVLASVVIVGRGFINSSRTGKAAEALSTIRKAGAVYTSSQRADSIDNEIKALQDRDLMPRLANDPANTWTMTGTGATAFRATSVKFVQVGNGWGAAINVTAPDTIMAEDLIKLVSADPAFHTSGPFGQTGVSCTPPPPSKPQTPQVTVCFKL